MPHSKPTRAKRVIARDPLIPDDALPDPGPSVRDHPQSRVIAHFVTEFILRSAEGIGALFDHDYEAAILFLTISVRNGEKAMNDPELRARYGSFRDTIPAEEAGFISRMALSRTTGLPRETVRRKVAALIAKGWVEEHAQGLRARTDLNRDPRYIATLAPQAQNLRRLFTMLLTSGALSMS